MTREHLADQAEAVDIERLLKALTESGCVIPESREYAAASIGDLVNSLTWAVLHNARKATNDQTRDMAQAMYQVMASMRPNTELLFYRDDDCPPVLEVHFEDGTTEVVGLDTPAGESVQIIDTTLSAQSHAAWMPVNMSLPAVLEDVFLFQVLQNLPAEEGNTLKRIGFMRADGSFVATYASNPDGSEEVLETVTHRAPMFADPVMVQP